MTFRPLFNRFGRDEDGGILVFWALSLVVFLGLLGLSFDFGRIASTQSELQSYADSASLAAAAELDGTADSLIRATRAAAVLISDTQTFGNGTKLLGGSDGYTLIFYTHDAETGAFVREAANVTTDPSQARFAEVIVGDVDVTTPFTNAASSLSGGDAKTGFGVMARAVAQFSLEACDVAPVAMCLPDVNFSAQTSIGQSLRLNANAGAGVTLPGSIRAVNVGADQLDGLSICAGLLGNALESCLVAAREPASSCTPAGGLRIAADVTGQNLTDAINTRFDQFNGIASGLTGPAFEAAPNVLAGQTTVAGLCVPLAIAPTQEDLSLPVDDCLSSGSCSVRGDGGWSLGRAAYVEAHYGGTDPFPQAQTRHEYYRAEVEAAANGTSLGSIVGGVTGGLLGGFAPQMCNPFTSQDPARRLMVVAAIDCSGASGTNAPVREYFEVFVLGPSGDGAINVEVTACLGGACGNGNLNTDVRDIVRLVE